jgi:hypothetical protein
MDFMGLESPKIGVVAAGAAHIKHCGDNFRKWR